MRSLDHRAALATTAAYSLHANSDLQCKNRIIPPLDLNLQHLRPDGCRSLHGFARIAATKLLGRDGNAGWKTWIAPPVSKSGSLLRQGLQRRGPARCHGLQPGGESQCQPRCQLRGLKGLIGDPCFNGISKLLIQRVALPGSNPSLSASSFSPISYTMG
jgi:hypothetical protein